MHLRVVGTVVGTMVALGYPIAIYYGLTHFDIRLVAVAMLVVALPALVIRLRRQGPGSSRWLLLFAPGAVTVALLGTVLSRDPRSMMLLPVLINLSLLITFGVTLRPGAVPIVERFARAQDPELRAEEKRYCRAVTFVWCGFFVVNGGIALGLALAGSLEMWTVYNGSIAYGLMGLLFAGEYCVRKYRFRKYGGGIVDDLLSALFPSKRDFSP